MFKKIKKCLATFITAAVMTTAVGCTTGQSTMYVMTSDNFNLKAGVYIYYQNQALNSAIDLASEADPNLDTTDEKALKETVIEEKKFLTWIGEKTSNSCREHITIIKKFDELGLTLSEEEIETVESYAENIYSNAEASKEYLDNGIGEESFKEILLNTYKANAIFIALYGEGGSENVQESDIKANYVENNARTKYIAFDLHNSDGSDMDEAGKKEIKDMANQYLTEAKNVSDIKKLGEKFTELQEKYDDYVEEKNNETSEEEATTTAPVDADTTTTTTTVDPYADEHIVVKVTTNADEPINEEVQAYSYLPSKAVHDWIFDPSTELNVPALVEDTENEKIYLAVRLDIEERMTDEDLWTESAIDSARFSMYSDELQDKLDEWSTQITVIANSDALERYGVFDYEEPETQANANNLAY